MVDFQSRDTRRGLRTDDDEDEDEPVDEGHDEGGHDHGEDGGHDHDHGEGGDHDHEHTDHHHAHDVAALGTAIVTVSSSRTLDDDPAGDVIAETMEEEGSVVTRELIPDDLDRIQQTVDALTGRDDVDVVVTTGGTGVTPDDVTVEAVRPLFSKELPGFGELFRILSFDEIGTRIVATRAVAGIAGNTPVFCLPGSENAARLGVGQIISEEAAHLSGLAQR